jgi:hypothetical protein
MNKKLKLIRRLIALEAHLVSLTDWISASFGNSSGKHGSNRSMSLNRREHFPYLKAFAGVIRTLLWACALPNAQKVMMTFWLTGGRIRHGNA